MMKCNKCGGELQENSKFCPNCGERNERAFQNVQQTTVADNNSGQGITEDLSKKIQPNETGAVQSQQPTQAQGYNPQPAQTQGYNPQPSEAGAVQNQQPTQTQGYSPQLNETGAVQSQQPTQAQGYNPQPTQTQGYNPQLSETGTVQNQQPTQTQGYNPQPNEVGTVQSRQPAQENNMGYGDNAYQNGVGNPAQAAAAAVAPAYNGNLQNYVNASEGKKKGSKMPIILVALAVLLVAIVAVVWVFFPAISNFFRANFSSPKDYYSFVENESLGQSIDKGTYNMQFSQAKDKSIDSEYTIKTGEKLADIVESSMSSSDSKKVSKLLKSIDSASVNYNMSNKNGKSSGDMEFKLNDTSIATANLIVDSDAQKMYFQVPELSEDYICYDLDSSDYGSYGSNAFSEYEELPTPKQINKVMKKYAKLMSDNIGEVQKSSETLTVSGVSQNCTLLTADIDKNDYVNMFTAVLKSAKTDSDVMAIVRAYNSSYDKKDYKKSIDDALEQLEDIKNSSSADTGFTYKVWVDNVGNVVGRALEQSDSQGVSISLLEPQNGDSCGYLFSCNFDGSTTYEISGSGKKSWGKLTGTFTVKTDGNEILDLAVQDFVSDTNSTSGKVKISLGSDYNKSSYDFLSSTANKPEFKMLSNYTGVKLTGSNGYAVDALLSTLSVELDINRSGAKSDVTTKVFAGSDELITVSSKVEVSQAKEVKNAPKNYYNADDSEDMSRWQGSVNNDEIMGNINESGVDIEDLGDSAFYSMAPRSYSDDYDYGLSYNG